MAFAFDRPVPAGKDEPNWWHQCEDDEEKFLVIDPVLQLQHARRLFLDPLFLRDSFTTPSSNRASGFSRTAG